MNYELKLLFIRGVFFIFYFIKNCHHEKSRFVRKKSTSGKPALEKVLPFIQRLF